MLLTRVKPFGIQTDNLKIRVWAYESTSAGSANKRNKIRDSSISYNFDTLLPLNKMQKQLFPVWQIIYFSYGQQNTKTLF